LFKVVELTRRETRGVILIDAVVFQDLWKRVRAGDEQAAAELVRRFEPLVRFEARLRITDPRLGRQYDSGDICQSVLASLFMRAARGGYDISSPSDLVRLLVVMARNKVASKARRLRVRDSDRNRDESVDVESVIHTKGELGPLRATLLRDQLAEVQRHLSEDETRILEMRIAGYTWPEVAIELGGTAEARRKQLRRAVAPIYGELVPDRNENA
jgi:RNA polymerase sigma factor (sigma-70 family)